MSKLRRIFFGALGISLSAALFGLFGAIVAFGILAFSGGAPEPPRASSPELSEFLLSSEKSRGFDLKTFEEGVFFMLLDNARRRKNGESRAVPTPPSFGIKNGALEVGIPFTAEIFPSRAKLGARVSLSASGGEIRAVSARIGDARLPKFAAEILARKLLEMYEPLNSPAFDALKKAKISVAGNKVAVEK